jgi:hypothetical protein
MRYFINSDGRKFSSLKAAALSSSSLTLNLDSVVQLLSTGFVVGNETLFNEVKKISSIQETEFLREDQKFISNESENVFFELKEVEYPVEQFITFFEALSNELSKNKIIIDLTGGADSRLIAVLLNHFGVKYDCFFDLNASHENEKDIVKKVAFSLDKRVFWFDEIESVSEIDILEALDLSDGLWNPYNVLSVSHTQRAKAKEGYDLVITGVGGLHYKDQWWQQDYPFYGIKRVNLKRLIEQRIIADGKSIFEQLGPAIELSKFKFVSNYKEYISTFVSVNNCKSYDQIYYNTKGKEQISLITKISENFIKVYSPLIEKELVEIGFNLDPIQRYFNNFYRKIMSELNPEVAKIRTSGSMTLSNNFFYRTADIGRYIHIKSKSKLNKLRATSKAVDTEPFSSLEQQAVNELINRGILRNELSRGTLSKTIRGRILAVWWNINLLNNR